MEASLERLRFPVLILFLRVAADRCRLAGVLDCAGGQLACALRHFLALTGRTEMRSINSQLLERAASRPLRNGARLGSATHRGGRPGGIDDRPDASELLAAFNLAENRGGETESSQNREGD